MDVIQLYIDWKQLQQCSELTVCNLGGIISLLVGTMLHWHCILHRWNRLFDLPVTMMSATCKDHAICGHEQHMHEHIRG